VARRIRSMEKSSDLIGNRICNHLACGIVPQPAMLPCAPMLKIYAEMNVLHHVECLLKLSYLNEN
jgi:hypothetical protein